MAVLLCFRGLYDLKSDPDEMNNLYGKDGFEQLTTQLKARMAELRKETQDTYEYKPTGIAAHPNPGAMSESGLVPRK